jgi:hypothetical protein
MSPPVRHFLTEISGNPPSARCSECGCRVRIRKSRGKAAEWRCNGRGSLDPQLSPEALAVQPGKQGEPCPCSPGCRVPWGTCHCGCGLPTALSERNSPRLGYVSGQPKRHVHGHGGHDAVHVLTEISPAEHTAACSACGPVRVHIKGRTAEGGVRWRCLGPGSRDMRQPPPGVPPSRPRQEASR